MPTEISIQPLLIRSAYSGLRAVWSNRFEMKWRKEINPNRMLNYECGRRRERNFLKTIQLWVNQEKFQWGGQSLGLNIYMLLRILSACITTTTTATTIDITTAATTTTATTTIAL
jgi:hypothetical protein